MKASERRALATFLDVLDIEHDEVVQRERPDFVMRSEAGVTAVEITRTTEHDLAHTHSKLARPRNGLAQRLREIVAGKEGKLADYREACPADAYWLLLHTEDTVPEVRAMDVRDIELDSAFDAIGIVSSNSDPSAAWARWLKPPSR